MSPAPDDNVAPLRPPFWRRHWKLAVAAIGALAFLLMSFPEQPKPYGPGIDSAWVYALNSLFFRSDVAVGRDYTFTVGPLGWLLYTGATPKALGWALTFKLTCHLMVAGAAVWTVVRRKLLWPALIALSAALVGNSFGFFNDGRAIFALAALALVAHQEKRRWPFALLGAFAGVCLFIKINIAVSAACLGGVVLLDLMLREKRRDLLVASIAGFFCVATLLAVIAFPSASALLHWARISADYAGGYSEAMSAIGPSADIFAAVAFVAFGLIVPYALIRKNRSALVYGVALLPLSFLSFKHGYVRQDLHVISFFGEMIGLLGLGALLWTNARELFIGGLSLLYAGSMAFVNLDASERFQRENAASVLSGRRGFEAFSQGLHLPQLRRELEAKNFKDLEADVLPARWLPMLTADGVTVDSLPSRLMYVVANKLRWKPSPSWQLYASYVPSVDAWNADHFAHDGPNFLILHTESIDGRYPLDEAPLTWRSILQNYELVEVEPYAQRILARKRTAPVEWKTESLGETEAKVDEPIAVPDSDGMVFASMDLQLSFKGVLKKALLRVNPIEIEAKLEDGRTVRYRILRMLAPSGLLVSPYAEKPEDFGSFFGPVGGTKVKELRVTGPGAGQLRKTFTVKWSRRVP